MELGNCWENTSFPDTKQTVLCRPFYDQAQWSKKHSLVWKVDAKYNKNIYHECAKIVHRLLVLFRLLWTKQLLEKFTPEREICQQMTHLPVVLKFSTWNESTRIERHFAQQQQSEERTDCSERTTKWRIRTSENTEVIQRTLVRQRSIIHLRPIFWG